MWMRWYEATRNALLGLKIVGTLRRRSEFVEMHSVSWLGEVEG
jgi:hypothetical protein